MNKDRLYGLLFILVFLCICILGVSVIVLSQKSVDQRIYSAEDIGIESFITSPGAVVYVGFHNTPYEEKEILDSDHLSSFNELLNEGCYQAAPQLDKLNKTQPGDNVYYYIRYSLGEDRLYIHVSGDALVVSVNGNQKYYYSNITSKVKDMIVSEYKKEAN